MKAGIACGGTGGHVLPGLVVAESLKIRGHEPILWLTGRDVEKCAIGEWEGKINRVYSSGFQSGLSFRHISTLFAMLSAFIKCRKLMKADIPDVLLGMGGYASVGPVLAAASLGVPVVLHESNAVPGRAVSFLSRFADTVALGFEPASKYIKHCKSVYTGFPVRGDLESKFSESELKKNVFTLLVMGGSQGAHKLNEVVPPVICDLCRQGLDVQVVHLTGKSDRDEVISKYKENGVSHQVFNYLQAIGKAYNAADLAIVRSGAATCAELAASLVPALFVPLPQARRDHQTQNAKIMRDSGGADMVSEKDFTAEFLSSYIKGCLESDTKLNDMRDSLRAIDAGEAAGRIIDLLQDIQTKPC